MKGIRANWGWSLIPTTQQATFFYGVVVGMVAFFTQETAFWVISGLMISLGIFWASYNQLVNYFWRRYRETFDLGLRGAVIISMFSLVQTWKQQPAYAFLGRACAVLKEITASTQMNTQAGGENIDGLIEATIYIVRGLFIVYLAIAAVNVFKLMQRDEDWQTAVRAPLIAVIMIAVVEGISAIIAPDTESGC